MSNIFGANALVNSIDMKVLSNHRKSGLTHLVWKQGHREVFIKCEKSNGNYKDGQDLKIFVNADDIALSTRKQEQITIQNQIEGTITDIIERESTLLCIVDAGFKLVVEITSESQKRLGLTTGSNIWCLFKSVAIDVAG